MYGSLLLHRLHRRDLRPPLLVDLTMLIVTAMLVCFSVVMVYSTTGVVSHEKFGDSLYYVKRQGVAALVGMAALWLVMRQGTGYLRRIAPYTYAVALALLLVTLVPGIGTRAGGAQRWIDFGFARFQPGEFVKLLFVIFIAGYFARRENDLHRFVHGMILPFAYLGPIAGLLLLQPDFGSSAILVMVVLAMSTAAGVRTRHLVLSLVSCGSLMGLMVITSPYRMGRVLSFLAPNQDVQGKGYQLMQSLIAVGTGHLGGVGLGESQQKLFFLPAAHTDFIYAVVAEELGFLGAVAVLVCFLVFLARGLALAAKLADDTFAFTLAVGLTLLIVGPALLNMGVVIGLLPTKGLVLPLVGYGGSSLVASLVTVGLLLALAREFRGRHL